MEINLRHGNPLELADQVFMFKRTTIREVALEHEIYATFMAKPMASEPGSAMHIHQSIVDADGETCSRTRRARRRRCSTASSPASRPICRRS